ncbi:rhomboid family intramembrane serine protease [Haloarchaeobius amylolyticus]|uniref:rhomboid family intramembrane serine protease n=1 Tax=Haloarchaeobius amylolyticus TaxID=1198296 RepID=UPI0022700597|nr:rhomboid family intramembrane serine protease [Haloarchaeobius amylolyticus]
MSRRAGSPTLETFVVFALVFALQLVVSVFQGLLGLAGFHDFLFTLYAPFDRPWTLVTSVYAHAGPMHLLSNAIALALVGFVLERKTSRFRYHAFFVVSGALAGLAQVLTSGFVAAIGLGRPTAVLGASGAVFALYGYVLGGNRVTDGVLSRFDVPEWAELLVFVVVAAAVTWATGAPGVALVAHFAGFLIGVAAGRTRLLATSQRSTHGHRKESY